VICMSRGGMTGISAPGDFPVYATPEDFRSLHNSRTRLREFANLLVCFGIPLGKVMALEESIRESYWPKTTHDPYGGHAAARPGQGWHEPHSHPSEGIPDILTAAPLGDTGREPYASFTRS
jgi:hypothetical protein